MRNIIFLDIDGVLNCEIGYKYNECQYVEFINEYTHEMSHYQSFYAPAKHLLNKLIMDTHADIVISSSWKGMGIEWLKQVWRQEDMCGDIIGVTDSLRHIDFNIPRGVEIVKWLLDNDYRNINWSKEVQQDYMTKSNINNFIIIDDDSDMLYNQRNHFVHTLNDPTNKMGFNQGHYEYALKILSKSIIELNHE